MIADASTSAGLFGELEDEVEKAEKQHLRRSTFSHISDTNYLFENEIKNSMQAQNITSVFDTSMQQHNTSGQSGHKQLLSGGKAKMSILMQGNLPRRGSKSAVGKALLRGSFDYEPSQHG